jgi:hypothetical protein
VDVLQHDSPPKLFLHFLSLLMETETASETSEVDPMRIVTSNPAGYLFYPANMNLQTSIPEGHFESLSVCLQSKGFLLCCSLNSGNHRTAIGTGCSCLL